jgi:hypothetical protein
MNKILILLFSIVVMFVSLSCNKNKTSQSENSESNNNSDSVKIELKNGTGIATLHKDSAKTVYICFTSGSYDFLKGKISVLDDIGNVRFNQIFMPDNKTDGPFGREITYDLEPDNNYMLSIGESLMQGDPWGGNLTVEIDLSNKIPYAEAKHYFVRNDFLPELLKNNKIDSQENFNRIFGLATTMNAKPTPIDFSKQYVIAIINDTTNRATILTIESLTKKDNDITLSYRENIGDEQTYTIRPFLLLVVDKSQEGNILINRE